MQALHGWGRDLLCGAALVLLLAATPVAAESTVPYVPTPQEVVDRMLDLGKVGPTDYLIDLGSGDGRIVVTAAKKFGTRGFGVDLDPERIAEANQNAREAGVADKVAFYQRDLFETDLSQATVITMYLLPQVNLALRPKLLALKPGTRIVSHDFSMNDWQPDQQVTVPAPDKYAGSDATSDVYLWLVPAKVSGVWQWQLPLRAGVQRYVFEARQIFQAVGGTVRVGSQRVPVHGAKLAGEALTLGFTASIGGVPVRHVFTGKVSGDAIEGEVQLTGTTLQSRLEWRANKVGEQ